MYIFLWIFILIASIILEFITVTSLISMWFAVGALLALLSALSNVSFFYQTVIFFSVSLISLFVFRPLLISNKRGNTIATNMDRFVGKQARLTKGIREDSWGEVKIDGIVWNAASYDEKQIEKGSLVEVLAIEGSKLIVKKIKEDI